MVTIAMLGDLGSGKTTMCTRYGILTKKLHPEKKLICNYHLKNYKYEPLDMMDLYLNDRDARNMIILADEFYTTMDCRVSSSYRNRIESYFIAMTRKVKADVYLTMQYETFIDCRMSPFRKIKLIMEYIPVLHNVVIDGIKYSFLKPHPYLFKCHLFDDRNNMNPTQKDFIFDGRRWFNEFDTNQVIYPPDEIIQKARNKLNKNKPEP